MTFWFLPCSAQNQSTVPTGQKQSNKKGLDPSQSKQAEVDESPCAGKGRKSEVECDDCASGKIQRPLCRHAPLRTARNRASDPGKEINLLPLLSSPSPVAPSRCRHQSRHSAGTHFHPLSLVCSAGWLVASWLASWEVKCFLARDRFGHRVMQGGGSCTWSESKGEPSHGKT